MRILQNIYKGAGRTFGIHQSLETEVVAVRKMLSLCPQAKETPLIQDSKFAKKLSVREVWIKDERDRMGLGSFKALGGVYVIASDAHNIDTADIYTALKGVTYVAASAGNHGISVAAGARIFGAKAVIFLSNSVPEIYERKLKKKDALVFRIGNTYEASMLEARRVSEERGWKLISDSSWHGYTKVPRKIMEGYLIMAAEAAEVLDSIQCAPTHIFLQAGVGGMAASICAYARNRWGHKPVIVVVEPTAAPSIVESVKKGEVTRVQGPISNMGRLDCKEPSLIALEQLANQVDIFVTIDDHEVSAVLPYLESRGLETTCSGAAGLAALMTANSGRDSLRLTGESRILTFLTEAPEKI